MTLADQIKILDRKIEQTEAPKELDRKTTKISVFSSANLDKYKYLTGEYLNYKPSTVEQAKFNYSPLNKFFNKGLKEEDKKEAVKNNCRWNWHKMANWCFFYVYLTPKAVSLIKEIKSTGDNVDYDKLSFCRW